jgi:hypothetical protein
MFRMLATLTGRPTAAAAADAVFALGPRRLSYLLDAAWYAGGRGGLPGSPVPVPVGMPGTRTTHRRSSITWDHLIYAYMIENTRAYEIFRRVVRELLHGEAFGLPLNDATHQWLRTTETLFFSDWAPAPLDLVSRARPDLEASRRNAYYRMFGMDLNHGADGGRAYPYEKPAMANRDFVAAFEELLRLVWRAIENEANTSGPKETDPEAIANLALRLQNMLNARRGGQATGLSLAQDEFVHVTTLGWFHLTVASDNAVITDLRAGGPSEEERLRLVGERVGVPAHGRSHSYFQIASAVSVLLKEIELGAYSTAALAPNLYALPPTGNPVRDNVLRVINHWSMITGRDMKAGKVTVSPRTELPPPVLPPVGTPLRPPAVALTATGGNGRTPAAAAGGGV